MSDSVVEPRYGMVLESPTQRGLVVMVLSWSLWEHRPGAKARNDGWSWEMDAVVLSDPGTMRLGWPAGSVQRIAGRPGTSDMDWMVLE